MAKIQVYRGKPTAGQTGGALRVNPAAMANTGEVVAERSKGRMISTAMNEVAKITAKIADTEQRSKLAAAGTNMDMAFNAASEAIEAEPDADKHDEIFQQFKKTAAQLGKDFKGDYGRDWTAHKDRAITAATVRVHTLSRSRRLDNARTNFQTAMDTAIDADDTEAAIEAIDQMEELGMLAPGKDGQKGQGQALKENARRQVAIGNLRNHIRVAPGEIIEALSKRTWRKEAPNITAEDRISLLDDANLQLRRDEQIANQRQRETYAASSDELYTMLIDKELTNATIDEYFKAGKIGNDIHSSYSRALNSSSPKVGDPQVFFALKRQMMDFREGKLSEEDMTNMLEGNIQNLTIGQMNGFFSDIQSGKTALAKGKPLDPITKARLDWGHNLIKASLNDGNNFGEDGSLQESQNAAIRYQQWEDFIETNPDDKSIEKFQEAMLSDVYKDGWFSRNRFDPEKWHESSLEIYKLLSPQPQPTIQDQPVETEDVKKRKPKARDIIFSGLGQSSPI